MHRFHRILPVLALAACTGGPGASSSGESARPLTCPPPDLFEAALCLCDDFDDVGMLTVGEGPSGPGSVGINGAAHFVNLARISGSLTAFAGLDAVAALTVGADLLTAGDAHWVGELGVGGDFSIGGDVRGLGALSVDGALRVGGEESLLGPADVAARAAYSAPSGPPCACDGDDFFDVAAAVDAARTANDNAAAGLPTRLESVGESELRLGTGVYYFEDARSVGRVRIVAEGEVSLFVDGSLAAVGDEQLAIDPGATLDLFVSGSVATVGRLTAGNASDPAAFRLYVGGADPVLVGVGLQEIYGSIYAPEAEIAYVGDTRIVGALFGDHLAGVGRLEIQYGAPGDLDPSSCEPPEDPDGDDPDGEEPDGGDPDGGDPDGEDPDGDDPDGDDPDGDDPDGEDPDGDDPDGEDDPVL